MRKPTAVQFFTVEIAVWFSIIGYIIWSAYPEESAVMFLAISTANISVAIFNMTGTIICMVTGWAPWRDKNEESNGKRS